MIDWVAVTEGVGILGGAAVWLVNRGRREREIDDAIEAQGKRLDVHESGCEQAWKEARESFGELKGMLTEQNQRSNAHREATTITLGEIQRSVAVLEENRRMRERQEDLR